MLARAPWSGLALLVVLTIALVDRKPVITVKGSWSGFGLTLGADGPVLAAYDIVGIRGRPTLRIYRQSGRRVKEEAKLPVKEAFDLEVSGERVLAMSIEPRQFEIYESRGRSWRSVQTIDLAKDCPNAHSPSMVDDVLVARSEEAICVFERRAGTWTKATVLRPWSIDKPVTNGDRIVQELSYDAHALRIWRRHGGAWQSEHDLPIAAGRNVIGYAISRRWLAVTTVGSNGLEIGVYILEGFQRVATLLPQISDSEFGYTLTMSGDAILASGYTQQLFRFRGTWQAAGTFALDDGTYRPAIGDLIWLGHSPRKYGPPGVIEGYALD